MNVFRRLPLYRLLLLGAVVLAAGVSATAIALAVDSGPKPPPAPLAQALHDALSAPAVDGVSASVTLTDHLLEGANLAGEGGSAGELASSPLVKGASGRLWISNDGHVRLELQAEKGDTQILYDGKTVTMYDAANNTLYRYTPPARETSSSTVEHHEAPTVAKIEEAIAHVSEHAQLSGATPTDIAGQPAYTVRAAPKEAGSLIGGAELSFDAAHGVPLRAAVYSTSSSAPVIELAATEITYGPVPASVFSFTPPADAKVNDIATSHSSTRTTDGAEKPNVTSHGHGAAAIAVVERKSTAGAGTTQKAPEGLPKVTINGVSATELRTALGTVLSFERSGVSYLLAGAVEPSAVEAVARGL
ncbi:MAG: hypothetical protein QOI03_71 [Solirubrobacteraceae bacterium]|nr:hypothetical protein [Solirubrobacteraceae bacterium]